MAKIPENDNTTLALSDRLLEKASDNGHRAHLGASLIGDTCLRKLWYVFHWCGVADHSGRILRLFGRGHDEEDRFNTILERAGVTVITADPVTGEQYTYSACDGHFGGSQDAALIGLIEAPKTWHVGEYKTHGDKSFKDLVKKGVEKSKPTHYAQVQVYMGLSGMTRAYYMAVNKNDDTLYSERIKFDQEFFDALIVKAHSIINAPEPMERCNEKLDWWECNFCDYKQICKFDAVPPANCRTCMHSTPIEDAQWHCHCYDTEISTANQKIGCKNHLFLPVLIPYATELVSFSCADRPEWIVYKKGDIEFTNCIESDLDKLKDVYTSHELHNLNHTLIGDETLGIIKTTFNATVEALD